MVGTALALGVTVLTLAAVTVAGVAHSRNRMLSVEGLTGSRFDLDDLTGEVHSLDDAASPVTDGGRDAVPDGSRDDTAAGDRRRER